MDATPGGGPLLLTEAQAAKKLGIPQTWIATERRKGNIPHHIFGRWIRYSEEDIGAILERHRIAAIADPLGLRPGSRRFHNGETKPRRRH